MAVRQWKEEDLPWTQERFKKGDLVTWSKKALKWNVPAKSRRDLRGRVVKTDASSSATIAVLVLWDGYKRPHSYAGCFITKAKG